MGSRTAEKPEKGAGRTQPGQRASTRGPSEARPRSTRALPGAPPGAGNRAIGRLLAGRTSRGGSTSTRALEQQADAVAAKVMPLPGEAGHVSRGATRGSAKLRTRLGDGPVFRSRLAAMGPGRPIEGGARRALEGKLDADLSHVRVHDGPRAAALSRDAGAKALTYGNHVVMSRGRYRPHTAAGRRLLAHEAAHTFQQGAPVRRRAGSAPGRTPGAPLAGLGRTGLRIQREEESDVTGFFQDSKKARIRARKVLDALKSRQWALALDKYKDADIFYKKAEFLGGAGWVKWFRGTSGDLNTARSDAKALSDLSDENKAKDGHLDAVAKVADDAYTASDIEHFWGTNHEHSADMTRKIAFYLIHALPQTTLHVALSDDALSKASTEQENPVAVLMMGGSGAGKGRVRDLAGVATDDMVHIDADDVKVQLPRYRDLLHEGDSGAAHAVHGESQDVVARMLRGAIASKQHLLYDATGANWDTYMGGYGVGGPSGLFETLTRQGYSIKLVMVYVPTEIAQKRVATRGEETGRVVPPSVVDDTHHKARSNFQMYASDGRVDSARLYENMGSEPILVWEKGKGRLTKAEALDLKLQLGELSDTEYFAKLTARKGGFEHAVSDSTGASRANAWDKRARTTSEHDEGTASGLVGKYGLTKAEAAAIYIYTAADYEYINPAVATDETWMAAKRGGKSKTLTPEKQQSYRLEGWAHARKALSGMAKLPDWQGTTWRGTPVAPTEIPRRYPPGTVFEANAFKSTSQAFSSAWEFADRAGEDQVPVMIRFELTKGKDVMPFADMKHEKEILLPPWSRFRISRASDRRHDGTAYKEVRMTQIT